MRRCQPALFLALGFALTSTGCGEPYLKSQVEVFVAESLGEVDLFPWKQQSKAVDKIVLFGKSVTPYLLDILKEPGKHIVEPPDPKVQQNVTVALCRIWNVKETHGRHVYCIRAGMEENRRVYDFWKSSPVWRQVAGNERP